MNEADNPDSDHTEVAGAAPLGASGPLKDQSPNPSASEFFASQEQPGATLGRYKLLEKLGEGGFGVVYVAEQKEPVRRRVALKIIKLGMDTRQVVARFEAERQALAMMDHPNIAKVFDAGATDTGRPYFVMELVRGIRITDYCDQHKLSTSQRLELFIMVCHAIQHAHQKGIIHRDIKPSNILITLHDGVPVPKVIDFGIAKATQQDLTEKTIYTQLQQFIGTPAYMSPEQAEMSGLDIDTRSDIYSLGVLLYELLTGRTPFDGVELMSLGIDALRKTIRDKEPPKPSSKVATLLHEERSTTADRHASDARRLVHLLRGDLDWIVMKCLEKDRTRRYETASGVAADIKRHLADDTVTARPPSSAYRFQKLVRRNRAAFATIGAVVGALLLGIIVSAWQAVEATHAKHEAVAAQAQESIQRQIAQENAQKALAAEATQTTLRRLAQDAELVARQRAYGSDMNLAVQTLDKNNLGQVLEFLNRQVPTSGQQDLRGWEWRYLWQQSRSDALFTLCRQSSQIHSLAVSPDGNLLAIGLRHKGALSIWDVRTRRQLEQLAPDQQQACAAFSPAGSLLAFTGDSVSADGNLLHMLHLWNTSTRTMVAQQPLASTCIGLAFSQDGATLLTSNLEGWVRWRVSGLRPLSSYPGHNYASAAAGTFATSDSGLAADSPAPGTIRVMDFNTGKERWTVTAGKQPFITSLAFSPDGKILASAAGFGESAIHLWDVASHQEIGRLEGHGSWVSGLVFWPDGKKMASCSADQTIRIWDLESRKCLDELVGHQNEVWRLALLPDGKTLVSGSKDGTVCFWDTSVTHAKSRSLMIPDHVATWHFSSDSQSLLTMNYHGQVARWTGPDFQQRQSIVTVPMVNYTASGIWDAAFSSQGRFLAVRTGASLQVWDLTAGVLARTIPGFFDFPQFLPNEEKLLAFQGPRLFQWNLATGDQDGSWLADDSGGRRSFAISPDGRHAIITSFFGGIYSFDLTGNTVTNVPIDYLEALHMAFSPDGKQLALASAIGDVRVWDAATWHLQARLTGSPHSVTSVAFSPDGKRLLAGGGSSGLVKLWDTESWQNVVTLQGQDIAPPSEFSPDGNIIGALSVSGNLQLWRAPSFEQIKQAQGNSNE